MYMKTLTLIAASLAFCLSAAAQPADGQRPDFQGGRPPMMGGEADFEAQEKYNAKQDKKLRKILGDDLHRQWRTKHPQERPKLPDVELQ